MEHNPQCVVLMEDISSGEHFLTEGRGLPRRVLQDISLLIRREEAWGINGPSLYEIKLLLEIMANIRPYDKGKCVLVERGMMRHKRVILNHVFYIGSSDMLYTNMNVLEFLMFATAKFKVNKVALQEQIFELLIDLGLGYLSLTPNHILTGAERAVVALLAAAYSESLMIVFNLPEYKLDQVLMEAVAKIAAFIRERGKTLILASQNCDLIERACSHTAIIKEGQLIYSGSVDDFRLTYDKTAVIVRDDALDEMRIQLRPMLPDYELTLKNHSLMIGHRAAESGGPEPRGSDPAVIYRTILAGGFTPRAMEINPKTVQNAYEELMRQHDLQE